MAVKTFTTETLTSADTNTYLANSGLVYVTSATIGTTVSSVTVSSAFSTTYDNYRVLISTVFSSSASRINLVGNGSTGTTHAGNWFYMDNSSGTVNGATGGSTSFFDIGLSSSTGRTELIVDLFNIFSATLASRMITSFAGHTYIGAGGGRDSNAASSTGFTLSPTSGTMTGGTITVYGYRKA